MKSLKTYAFIFLQFLLLNGVNAQRHEDSINAEKVISNAIKALGGKEYLQNIKTLYCDITTEMQGRQVHWITKEMLPNKGAFQIVYNDRIVFQNFYNGEKGFEIVNGQKKEAEAAEFKDKPFKKNIFNELDYLDSTLWKIELLGEEKVNGEDCYKIKASLANGLVKHLFYSKKTFFMLREDKISNTEKNAFETTYFGNYKQFGKLTYFTEMKFGNENKFQLANIVDLQTNKIVTDKDFE